MNRATLLLAAALLSLSLTAQGQGEPRISELSYLDRQYMSGQRESLEDLVARNYGRQFTGVRENDLDLLQRLLDNRLVRSEQTRELQAMGIVIGDLLAQDLGLHWVIYEDRLGRTRALRYKNSDSYLFPVTMISRRREVGNETPVVEIYQKAEAAIKPAIPSLPFQ